MMSKDNWKTIISGKISMSKDNWKKKKKKKKKKKIATRYRDDSDNYVNEGH